jgi:hypothetical protein
MRKNTEKYELVNKKIWDEKLKMYVVWNVYIFHFYIMNTIDYNEAIN